ncbi:L-threonylcarbamoyladenylate synthase [Herpetosiphon giganteus]|uniref:L-threonylcarbamoyladenylate synthase n=1 Tax=Herpetosiphon giganteus TaxID=2029754 RepID=UPI00195E7149|nr:L-threonylcarbamoyladenylate synthase [Herpetosiphon giganteus]MBM7841622.1 L-threonylcarbamoyladenylate synthase [Herpetosiphon giganteus]
MITQIADFDDAGLALALQYVQQGQILCFPTDTVYGIGGSALDEAAIAQVFAAKARPATVALPVLLADIGDLAKVAHTIPDLAWRLAEAWWPGGLTLVLPALANLPKILTADQATIAVRVPKHGQLRKLIGQFGTPIAGTSANLHGQPTPSTAQAVADQLAGRVPLVLDGGIATGDQPSTIVDLSGERPSILRHGVISAAQLSPWLEA